MGERGQETAEPQRAFGLFDDGQHQGTARCVINAAGKTVQPRRLGIQNLFNPIHFSTFENGRKLGARPSPQSIVQGLQNAGLDPGRNQLVPLLIGQSFVGTQDPLRQQQPDHFPPEVRRPQP